MGRRSSLIAPFLLGILACGSGRKNAGVRSQAGHGGDAPAVTGETNDGNPSDGGVPPEMVASGGDGGAATTIGSSGASADTAGAGGQAPTEVSEFCGDAIRDPVSEACDDGSDDGEDSCSPSCETRNLLVVGGTSDANLSRRLGFGRHPLATSVSSAALVYTEIEGSSASLRLARFNPLGQRLGEPLQLSAELKPGDSSNAVVAALPNDGYVAAWGDLSDGSLDVVLRPVSAAGDLGSTTRANATTSGAQLDPDLLWANGQLVAAWTDTFAIKARTFSAELTPTSGEQTLSSAAFAGNVSLAAHATSWAAAFRESADAGREQIAIVLDDGTRFVTAPFDAGPTYQRPALLSLNEQYLLLVFCAAEGGASRLQGVILNAAAPDEIPRLDFPATLPPYNFDSSLDQTSPGLTRLGERILLTWQSSSPLGDPLGEELFVRDVSWSASSPDALDLTPERPLPVDWMRAGTQQAPVIEAATFEQGDALLSVFEHAGVLPGSKVTPDLIFGFVPQPIVEASIAGGGS